MSKLYQSKIRYPVWKKEMHFDFFFFQEIALWLKSAAFGLTGMQTVAGYSEVPPSPASTTMK